jgi:hypothetical protein
MAVPRNIPVQFGDVFPHGAFAVGEVYATKDFDKSTREHAVQATDKESGKLLWSVDVVDGDPEATKSTRSLTVKIPAKVQPVLPDNPSDSPFRPVEFDKLTISGWVESVGDFNKVSYSFRAADVKSPSKSAGAQQRPSAA